MLLVAHALHTVELVCSLKKYGIHTLYIHIYIYIYRETERERDRENVLVLGSLRLAIIKCYLLNVTESGINMTL